MFVSSLEALPGEGPDVNAGKDRLWLFRELNGDDDIWVVCVNIINTVNQCFIQVKNYCLSL
jgi:hypothetical protein